MQLVHTVQLIFFDCQQKCAEAVDLLFQLLA